MAKPASSFLRSSHSTSNTVIVLLGWAGAKDVHLEKYCKLYTCRGYDTLRFTADYPDQWDSCLRVSRNVKGVVNDLKRLLETNDVAFHLFSMNGVYTLCSLGLQYPELRILQKTKGIIFDSAPIDLGFEAIGNQMQVMDHVNLERLKKAGLLENLQFRLTKGWAGVNMLRKVLLFAAIRQFGGDLIKQYSPYYFLMDHPEVPKVLYFVYSEKDRICPSFYIEKFANSHANKGRLVNHLRFKDSFHVLHYRKYPKEYERFVDSFLKDIKLKSSL